MSVMSFLMSCPKVTLCHFSKNNDIVHIHHNADAQTTKIRDHFPHDLGEPMRSSGKSKQKSCKTLEVSILINKSQKLLMTKFNQTMEISILDIHFSHEIVTAHQLSLSVYSFILEMPVPDVPVYISIS